MKAKRITMLWMMPFVAAPIALSSAMAQQASTTEWNADPETPGNWTDTSWTASVPTSGSLAGIVNGGTVDVTTDTATLEQLQMDQGATLNIGALLEIQGTDQISNPDPDPPTPATGLYVFDGTIDVSAGGTLDVGEGGVFFLGRESTAFLNLLNGGTLRTNRNVNLGNGGPSAFGTLTLDGGTIEHTDGQFQVGPNNAVGQLDILDGTATIHNLRVNLGGNINTQENVVNHSGGDVTYTGEAAVGWGAQGSATYNLSGGSITTTSRMRIGVSNVGDETRVNTFNQTGGDVDVTGRIDIGDNAPPEVTNIYDMSGGTLRTTARILVGAHGSASGTLKLSGFANIDIPEIFIGNSPTNNGNMIVDEDASAFIGNLEICNGSYIQSGIFSNITVAGRLWVGGTQTVGNTATMTMEDGMLELPSNNIVGNGNAGDATFHIHGGTITTTDRLRIGNGAADGSLTPTNLVDQTGGEVDILGRLDIGQNPGPTNIYQISGGTLRTNGNVLVGFDSDGTGTFTVDGDAEVDVPAVIMGENAGTNDAGTRGTVQLLGGTLTTNQIRVGNGIADDQTLILDGGTIRARTGGSTLIGGNVTTASLLSGGITFDTDGLDVATSGIMTGPGGMTKTGSGTLTVNGVQAYTGATRVEEGTLVLNEPFLADNGDVYLTTGAVLDLAHGSTNTIGTLFIDGQPQPSGTYGGGGTGADTELAGLMAGTGILISEPSAPTSEPLLITSITVDDGLATITISGEPNTTYVCRFSDDLVTPFEPIATDPATVTTDGGGEATFTVDAGAERRFYVVGPEN